MLVAIGSEARRSPGPLTCPELDDLVSALHALGAAFAVQSLDDRVLNSLIRAVDARHSPVLLPEAASLLGDLEKVKDDVYVQEVRDLHGTQNIERYRRMKHRVIAALREAVDGRRDLEIGYFE